MPALDIYDDATDGRIIKRQKTNADISLSRADTQPGTSRLFAPYRTIGLVSPTAVPFASIPLGKTTFQLTTSVGRALQTYDVRRGLNLVFITRPETPANITASAVWKDLVFAAWGSADSRSGRGVWVYKRGKKVQELEWPQDLQEDVKSFCVFGSWIVGCCESQLVVWKSTTFEHYTTLAGISGASFSGCITTMPTLLNKVAAGKADGTVEIWNVSSGKLLYSLLSPDANYGAVTALQPAPALSLLAIAYQAGPLVIQDVRTDCRVMQFNAGGEMPSGPSITSITFRTDGMGAGDDGRSAGVMATASAQSGDITLWNLNNGGRRAGVLRGAHAVPVQTASGGVSKIEFLPGQSVLVSSGLDNSLKTWIFDEVPFSPIPRPLHSRSGHGAPITSLAFLPSASDGSDMSGKWLLAGSKDRSLWGWSLRRDGQSTELSQGAIRKKAKKAGILASDGRDSIEGLKAPPITCVACSLNRDGGVGATPGKQSIWQGSERSSKSKSQGDTESSGMTGWESVVTAHEGDNKARTWFWGRKRAGRWAFETGDKSEVKSISISPCGTFALVGSATGGIDMFNLQSGIHRQRFPPRLTPNQAKQLKIDLLKEDDSIDTEKNSKAKKFYRGQGKHAAAVTGLAVDNLNKTVISCGADGKIKFWDFVSGSLRSEIDWSGAVTITGLRFHRSSELAGFSCSDGCIRVIDTSTQKLVRELRLSRSSANPLSHCDLVDFCFSEDGRWISAATSSLVCLWDLPTGHLVDAFKLPATCNALSFSPTGEYLATASSDSVGVNVWTNKTLFTHVPTRHIDEDELLAIVDAEGLVPTASGEGAHSLVGAAEVGAEDVDGDFDDMFDESSMDQLSSDLVSLSIVPRSRWQNLLHLDVIRQRNKPVEPPKKPEKAPFFLPSIQERQKSIGTAETQDLAILEQERSRIMKMDRAGNQSKFTNLLQSACQTDEYDPFLSHLKSLNPAAADVEIRSLSVGSTVGDTSDPVAFVKAVTHLLRSRHDFELGQAWLAVFLHLHADIIVEDEALRDAISEWRIAAQEEKERVQTLAEYCGGVVGYFRAGRV